MIKTKTVETIGEFDENGKLLKRTVTETEETNDDPVKYTHTSAPYIPFTYQIPKFDPPPVTVMSDRNG